MMSESVCVHRRIQDFVRGGKALLARGGGPKALLAPLDPRLTIWGSNFLWGGGANAPLPPPGSAPGVCVWGGGGGGVWHYTLRHGNTWKYIYIHIYIWIYVDIIIWIYIPIYTIYPMYPMYPHISHVSPYAHVSTYIHI